MRVSSNQVNLTMAHDVGRGVTELHGAQGNQTWEWDGATWRMVTSSGPPLRYFCCMVYDSQRSKLGHRRTREPEVGLRRRHVPRLSPW
ncbi:MAG: hypothetical protein AAF628_01270 [Planctomycetota bacterium]